jgi:hypothetical protein
MGPETIDFGLRAQREVTPCSDCVAIGLVRGGFSFPAKVRDFTLPAPHELVHRLDNAAAPRPIVSHLTPSAV